MLDVLIPLYLAGFFSWGLGCFLTRWFTEVHEDARFDLKLMLLAQILVEAVFWPYFFAKAFMDKKKG